MTITKIEKTEYGHKVTLDQPPGKNEARVDELRSGELRLYMLGPALAELFPGQHPGQPDHVVLTFGYDDRMLPMLEHLAKLWREQ